MTPEARYSRSRGSLFLRVMALMLIAVGLPLAVLSFVSVTYLRSMLLQDWNVLQTQVGQSVGAMVGSHVQGSLAELSALDAGLRDAAGNLDMPAVSTGRASALFLQCLQGGSQALHLELIDMRGQGVRAGYEYEEAAVARRIEDTFSAALSSETPVVGRPVFSTRLNQLLVVIARALSNGRSRAGVLLSVISLEPVLEQMREGSWSGISVLIVDQNGQLIADLERNRMIENLDYSGNEIVKALLTGVRGLGAITRSYVGSRAGQEVPMIGTGVLIPETGWAVIAEIPRSHVYSAVSPVIRRLAILSAAAMLLVLLLSAFFSHRMVRPLRRLADSAREVASGNFSAEIQIEDTSEIGAVAEAFREMTRQVRDNLARLNRAVEDSKQLFTGTVRAFANAIDAKDPYTRGHSERVTRFSLEIAKIMELAEDELEKTKIGALIHDIGKIAIDDKILKKPGALTDEEFQVMMTHTVRGYEMMKHIPQLQDVIAAMHSHHEQLDGKGYPQGLHGDEIPMLARIVMVADCFDAMTTKRPYQDPTSIDYVLGVIRSLAGKKYDEQVVEALVRGVKTGRIIPHSAT